MKRKYIQPKTKTIRLWAAEQMMNGSGGKNVTIYDDVTMSEGSMLSNEENKNLWGNEGIWD